MARRNDSERYGICISNQGCDDLVLMKLYRILPDREAARDGYVRVVDESQADYLYPKSCFVVLRPSRSVREAAAAAAAARR